MTWTFGLLALLASTGAGFVWGYERHVRSYTQHVRDRLVRLTFAGAICLSIYAGPLYLLYNHYFANTDIQSQQLPFWIWPCLIVSVVLPWVAGEIIGRLLSKQSDQVSITIPTGFDYVMNYMPTSQTMILFVHLKSDMVVVGCPKHAAVTPHVLDIYLHPVFFQGTTIELNDWINLDEVEISQLDLESDRLLEEHNDGILVRYEDVSYIYVKLLKQDI